MLFLDNLALLAGRLLLAALLLPSGVKKLLDLPGTTAYMTRMGVPAPDAMAIVAGALETGLPILLILGLMPRITAILTGGFILVATLTAHRFWELTEAGPAMMQQIQFLKNLGLIGGTMFYFVSGAGRFALSARK